MKKIFISQLIIPLAVLVFILPGAATAQEISNPDIVTWPTGKVVLVNGDSLIGAITYHRSQDVIEVEHNEGHISTLSPVNVDYFIVNEIPSGRPHLYKTYDWNLGREGSDFKKPTFFEQLNQGTITLIMREAGVRKGSSRNAIRRLNTIDAYYTAASESDDEKPHCSYFALLPNGEILELKNVKKQLHSLFGKKSDLVKNFVKNNDLSYDNRYELAAIVNYYNSL